MSVKAKPDGYHSVTPYLICKNAKAALDFYARALGAKERFKLVQPDGRVGHAEIEIGDSVLMIADEFPEMDILGPAKPGSVSVSIHVYVDDVDRQFKQALAAGGKEKQPLKDQFYGDRSGSFVDPFGHVWHLATHKEDVPPAEMERRTKEMFAGKKN
jgi:PhnB protein